MSRIDVKDIGEIERLQEVFLRVVESKPKDPDDRVHLAQSILCNITQRADEFLETDAENQAVALKTVENVLMACAKAVENSGVPKLKALGPEIREHAVVYTL